MKNINRETVALDALTVEEIENIYNTYNVRFVISNGSIDHAVIEED